MSKKNSESYRAIKSKYSFNTGNSQKHNKKMAKYKEEKAEKENKVKKAKLMLVVVVVLWLAVCAFALYAEVNVLYFILPSIVAVWFSNFLSKNYE